MKVKKAVIPVAGLGTRMLPMTKVIPKEMLPIADKPMIQYIVEECAKSGIKEVVFVTHSSKNAIENHFDSCYELESILEKRVKRQQLDEVKSITPKGVTIMHVRQGVAKGLGHAILCAYPVIGDEPFAVLLPDVLIDNVKCDFKKDNLSYMVQEFDKTQKSQILVETVPKQDVSKYGIVDLDNQPAKTGQSIKIKQIVEKPEVDKAPSDLAVVGRYVFSKNIWSCLKRTPLGVGDEIQLTDAIDLLMEQETVEATPIKGLSHDCGSKKGYLTTSCLYALRDPEIRLDLSELSKLVD